MIKPSSKKDHIMKLEDFAKPLMEHPLAQKAYILDLVSSKKDTETKEFLQDLRVAWHSSCGFADNTLTNASKDNELAGGLHYVLRGFITTLPTWAKANHISSFEASITLMLASKSKDILVHFQNLILKNLQTPHKPTSNKQLASKMRSLCVEWKTAIPSIKFAGASITSKLEDPPQNLSLVYGSQKLYDNYLGIEWKRDFRSWPFPTKPLMAEAIYKRILELAGDGTNFRASYFMDENLKKTQLSLLPFVIAQAGYSLYIVKNAFQNEELHKELTEELKLYSRLSSKPTSSLTSSCFSKTDLAVFHQSIPPSSEKLCKLLEKSVPVIIAKEVFYKGDITSFVLSLENLFANTNYHIKQIEGFLHNYPHPLTTSSSSPPTSPCSSTSRPLSATLLMVASP